MKDRKYQPSKALTLKALSETEWTPRRKLAPKLGRMLAYSNPAIWTRVYGGDLNHILRDLQNSGKVEAKKRLGFRRKRRYSRAKGEPRLYPLVSEALVKEGYRVAIVGDRKKKRKRTPDLVAIAPTPHSELGWVDASEIVEVFEVKDRNKENPKNDLRQADKYKDFGYRTWVCYVEPDSVSQKQEIKIKFQQERGDVYREIGLAFLSTRPPALERAIQPTERNGFRKSEALRVVGRGQVVEVCLWCKRTALPDVEGKGLKSTICDDCWHAFRERMFQE
jgi:hypothetical protein